MRLAIYVFLHVVPQNHFIILIQKFVLIVVSQTINIMSMAKIYVIPHVQKFLEITNLRKVGMEIIYDVIPHSHLCLHVKLTIRNLKDYPKGENI